MDGKARKGRTRKAVSGRQTRKQDRKAGEKKAAATRKSGRKRTWSTRPKSMSLHIGLNTVSPAHYGGWNGAARGVRVRRQRHGGDRQVERHEADRAADARRRRARTCWRRCARAAKALKSGDLFFLPTPGHGGQVPDVTGEEPDKQDETWCLYDGQLIDDELYFELSRFAERRAHPRALRQLPQRHGHARAAAEPTPTVPARARR